MLTLIEAVALGVIQGVTEWLPISSSGHLVIAQQLFNVQVPVFYDILLHVATLVVILLVFYKDIFLILKEFFNLNFKSEYGKLGLFIILGSIPTGLIGIFFRDTFMQAFSSLNAVAFGLIFTGTLLTFSELLPSKKKIKWYHSVIIGIMQGVAIFPGISRSGSTISTGLILGIEKTKVAKFSFLLSVPAIIGATILEFNTSFIQAELLPIITGMVVSIIVGYFSLKLLLKMITKQKFHLFAFYCLTLGLILLLI
ncbi:MAG: undecaprenyl-diphosphate phosphatase [archaeon]